MNVKAFLSLVKFKIIPVVELSFYEIYRSRCYFNSCICGLKNNKCRSQSCKKKRRLGLAQKHAPNLKRSLDKTVDTEIKRFNSVNEQAEDPLLWWKNNEKDFPILFQLARVWLSSMVTSAVPKQLFMKLVSNSGCLSTRCEDNTQRRRLPFQTGVARNFC